MKTKRFPRGLYAPEALETRIAPATFIVDSLLDNGADGTLRKEITDANNSPGADSIVFKGDALEGEIVLGAAGQIAIADSLTIKGPGAGRLLIDAGDVSRIFFIDDTNPATVKTVSISGLSMVDGFANAGSGGGIYSRESLTLSNVVISGCNAGTYGGGVFANTAGRLIVKASIINGNTAGGNTGGLYLHGDAGVQVTACTITGNTGGQHTGGLYARIDAGGTGDILIEKSTIVGNAATTGRGGGVNAENAREVGGAPVGKILVRSSVISGNSAGTLGGGLYLDAGHVRIERSVISNNVAEDKGGGVYARGLDSLTIKSSTIAANRTTDAGADGGGGVFLSSDPRVLIQSTLLSGNSTVSKGGGLHSVSSVFTLKSSTLSGNSAGQSGGGLYATGGSVAVESTVLADNRAIDYGGAIATNGTLASKIDLVVKSSRFTANRAESGGGAIRTHGDGAINVSGSKFFHNSAGVDGGAMYLHSTAETLVVSCLIAQNHADYGGGLEFGGAGAKEVRGTLIRDNAASTANGEGGGVLILASSGPVVFKTSSIMYNSAMDLGGGISNRTATAVALNGSKVVNNTAPVDAQINGPATL